MSTYSLYTNPHCKDNSCSCHGYKNQMAVKCGASVKLAQAQIKELPHGWRVVMIPGQPNEYQSPPTRQIVSCLPNEVKDAMTPETLKIISSPTKPMHLHYANYHCKDSNCNCHRDNSSNGSQMAVKSGTNVKSVQAQCTDLPYGWRAVMIPGQPIEYETPPTRQIFTCLPTRIEDATTAERPKATLLPAETKQNICSESHKSREKTVDPTHLPFYHPDLIDCDKVYEFMRNLKEGSFLIRKSSNYDNDGSLTLSIRHKTKFLIHLRILNNNGTYVIGDQKSKDFSLLVEHFKEHPIPNVEKVPGVFLKMPVCAPVLKPSKECFQKRESSR